MKQTDYQVSGKPATSAGTVAGIAVDQLNDTKVWLQLKESWDGWCAQAPHPSFFCASDWLETWWDTYGTAVEPWILRVRRDNTDLGYAPLMRVARRPLPGILVRSIEFIGTGERVCPDYLDVIARPGEIMTVRRAVGEYLRQNHQDWDRLWLTDGLAGDSLSDFIVGNDHNWAAARIINGHVCPYVDLSGDWETMLSGFRRHMRRKIRQISHRIEREQKVHWRVHTPEDDPDRAVKLMTDLHTRARRIKGETGNFADPEYRRLHTDLIRRTAKTGQLYLGFLSLADRPAAFFYGFILGDRFFNYQTGYDPEFARYRPGWYALSRLIQDLIERGCSRVDFLRGDHDYKWHWANGWFETVTGVVYSSGLSGRLYNCLHRVRDGIGRRRVSRSGPPDFVQERLSQNKSSR